jgi:excisionase family DNA binding protein
MRFYEITAYLLLTCIGALAEYAALCHYIYVLSGGIL